MSEFVDCGSYFRRYFGKYEVRAYPVVKHAKGKAYHKFQARVPAAFRRENGRLHQIPFTTTDDTLDGLERKLKYLFRLDGFEIPSCYENLTIAEYSVSWLERTKSSRSSRTNKCYRRIVNKVIVTGMGDRLVATFSGSDADCFLLGLIEQGKSPGSVRRIKSVLRSIFENAVLDRICIRNPVNTRLPKAVQKPRPFLEIGQVELFLEAAAATRFSTFYEALLYTGCRPAELVGLTWDNVDYESLSITIDHQYQEGEMKPTKTRRSRVIWAIDRDFRSVLDRQREVQRKQKESLGDKWSNPMNLVFTNKYGRALDQHTLTEEFAKIRESLGIDRFTMYSLRHTYATHTYAKSGRIDMVKENLGHEKYETTEIYIGTLEQSRNEYRKCMNGHWKNCMSAGG